MLILYNANIFGIESTSSALSALVIQNHKILEVGESTLILSKYGQLANSINMNKKVVWPGLIDAHIHLGQYGLSFQKVDCETPSINDCLNKVREKAQVTPSGEWVIGHGWNQNDWPEGFGNAQQLDEVAPNNPVYLTSKSIHSAWANSKALLLAGITKDSPSFNGLVQKDKQGNPTGILFESTMALCEKVIPTPTISQLVNSIQTAQKNLLMMGLTGVHDFDLSDCFTALQRLQQDGNLNIRVIKGLSKNDLPQAISIGLQSGFGNEFLRIGPIKLFADGALGPRTAALFDSYEGEINNHGLLLTDADEILNIGKLAVPNGISLAIHAIGDRAVHEVFTGYTKIRAYENEFHFSHLRHRIEHAQLLGPQDINLFSELQIIASMQPVHATSDMYMADRYWGDRSKYAYAWKTIENTHAVLAFGSDAPVESPNPFHGLYAAITRRREDGKPGPNGWHSEQKISLLKALKAYTFGSAYAAGMENQLGKIAPGFFADLIVLNEDPFSISLDQIPNIQPIATMIGGEWVWKKG